MIWGEVINAVRSLHLELIEQFQLPLKTLTQDLELESAKNFIYPGSTENFEEWEWISLPEPVQEALELHPVERALIEGPLLPIECIRIRDHAEMQAIYEAVFALEKEWLEKARVTSPDKTLFIEHSLKLKWLKLQTRAGLNRLKAV
jgi:hypothetical protein